MTRRLHERRTSHSHRERERAHKQKCKRAFEHCHDLKKEVKPALREDFLRVDAWFVDAENGDDRNGGTTETCPLKTFLEIQRRVGVWTFLNPRGGLLRIRVLSNELVEGDRITLINFLAPGAAVRITGTKVVLLMGEIDGAADKDRAANDPWVVTAAGAGDFAGNAALIIQTATEKQKILFMNSSIQRQVFLDAW